jgi:hypothetical protein
MSWRTVTRSRREGHHGRGWRQIAAILAIGLALLIAACGTSTSGGGGSPPTPTPKPTPSPTPAPCASWRTVSSPNAPQHQMSVLYSLSAISPSAAWAVGSGYNESSQVVASLIERWDGSTWQVVANAGTDELHGIAALSATDIWAVGGFLNYGGRLNPNQPLIMHWNGTQWSIVPGVRPAGANAVQLDAVAALASNDVWAVGRQDVGAAHLLQPLIERWDGTAWHAVTAPVPSGARE